MQVMVKVRGLTKRYGNHLALDNVSFEIKKGDVLGLLGSNGAGKSTTMNIITGYIAASDGKVEIGGLNIAKNPVEFKRKIGYLPEQPPLYLDMTVKGYLNFVYDLKKIKLNKREHIEEICKKVAISDVSNRIIRKLSKGYKQRVGIAQALLGYPPLIILDEPTVGLDPKQLISIRALIKDLAKEHTVIFSSHMLNEVQEICSRVVVIDSGKIVADSETNKIAQEASDYCSLVLHVEGDSSMGSEILRGIEGVTDIKGRGDIGDNIYEYVVEYKKDNDIRKTVFKEFALHGLSLIKLDIMDTNLEDAFLKITENSRKKVSKEQAETEDDVEEGENVDFLEDLEDSSSDSYDYYDSSDDYSSSNTSSYYDETDSYETSSGSSESSSSQGSTSSSEDSYSSESYDGSDSSSSSSSSSDTSDSSNDTTGTESDSYSQESSESSNEICDPDETIDFGDDLLSNDIKIEITEIAVNVDADSGIGSDSKNDVKNDQTGVTQDVLDKKDSKLEDK